MYMTKHIYLSLLLGMSLMLASCGSSKKSTAPQIPQSGTVNLGLLSEPQANKYVNLDYGIKLTVNDGRASDRILKKYDASSTVLPYVTSNPEVKAFVEESTRRYMRTLGFNLAVDVSTDYSLALTIKDFTVNYLSGLGWSAVVSLNVEVYDKDRKLVYPSTLAVGRANISGSAYYFTTAAKSLNTAYMNALNDIDWDRIAYFLKRSSNPAQEANKQVTGDGNTALEHTVIRWYIDSSPKGADVNMRVVSSTPEVKNTNSNFVGSTPYETTETFDIKGLTFGNSGNVQIELTCEKAGYITQKRRFNLRQVIEQKEISAKFNLVKDE